MNCTVVRSSERDFTYLYLRDGFVFEDLPGELQKMFGTPQEVMQLELTAGRQLAQQDVKQVMSEVEAQGFFLQLPPSEDPSGWLELPAAKPKLID